jgi:hypothetical protein
MASITLKDLVEEQQETNMRLDEIDDRFLQFFEMLRADKLDMLELMSELRGQKPSVPAVPPEAPATTPTEGAPEGLKFGFKTLVAGLGVALAASWAAYLDNIKSLFRNLRKGLSASLNKTFATVGSILRGIVNRLPLKIQEFFQMIGNTFTTLVKNFKESKFAEKIKIGVEKVKAFVGSIRGFFTSIADKIGAFGANLKESERLKPIIEFFKQFGGKDGLFSKLFGVFRSIGRIFLPLTAIIEVGLGIFREVTALEEGAGFMDYLKAGVKGIIKGLGRLITMPLDLLKNGISWIAEKLGFDQFSAVLDSFSFTGLFDKLVDGPLKFIKAIGAGTGAAFAAALPGGESPTEAFGRVFSEVMASDSGGQVSTDGVTATATSASINEPPPEEASRPRTRADVRRQRMEAQAAEEAGQAPTVTVINNTNAPTTTTNNSTTTGGGAPLPQPTQSNGSRADAYAGA